MRDTWMGSGINSVVRDFWVTCPECNADWEDEFTVDDWGNVDEDVTCYKCDTQFNFYYSKHDKDN